MASSIAREKAAQAWCTPETEGIEMDSELAEAFANILDNEVYENPIIKVRDGLLVALTGELSKKDDGYQTRVHELSLSFAIIMDRV